MKIKLKHRFKKEFRRQLRTAISAAAGFIIAYAWKDFLFKLIEKYVQNFTTMTSILNVSFVSAFVTTSIGVLVIIISAELLK